MSSTKNARRDPRDVARDAIKDVEAQLAMTDCSPRLREAWATLVDALALGPAPDTLACPSCGKVGMLAATRCGYCWVRLRPAHDAIERAP